MKRFIITFCLLSVAFVANIYGDDGDWHIYSAYHNATKVVETGGVIYVLSDGGLYSYDPEDALIETFDKATILSDFGIYDILECSATKELVIIYNNGNIDLLSSGGSVYNMSELKTKSLKDKTLNDAIVEGKMLYISTNSGIVCVDLENRSFADFYDFGQQVLSMVVTDGYIICSTQTGPYRGSMSQNLLDPSKWEKVGGSSKYLKYRMMDGVIYCMYNGGMAYVVENSKMNFKTLFSDKTTDITLCNGKLYVASSTGKLYVIDNKESYKTVENTQGVKSLAYSGATYWAACQENGLMGLGIGDEGITEKVASIIPNSPYRNYTYKMNLIGNNRLLIVGGTFNYTANSDRTATIMRYEDGTWTYFDDEPLELYGQLYYRNAIDVVQDPDDPNHHYVGTARSGIYEFQDFKFKQRYSFDNSPVTSILPDDNYAAAYVRIAGLQFDSRKNLWMCNTECDTIIRILRADNKWVSYYVPEIKENPTFDHILFDSRGYAWINSRRGVDASRTAGVLIVDPGSDPGDPKGFHHKYFDSFYNQDGTLYSPTLMNSMCFDLDGSLWLGYEVGLFVSYRPEELYSSSGNSTTLTQVKVPRNDGTNLADYLLNGVPIKCITIDGGNRKWIGTEGQGVYLVSSDGLETISHFTKENSPLIDDDIYDIKVNGETGEVYFATNAGLCSYMGDAVDPVASFDKDLVKVYPNPVRPEHVGNIVIRGLKYDSNVKIVNAAGKLVNEGVSVGGEYTWDGCLQSGKRCGSGIYYILATDAEGKNGVVGKFLVVNE